MKINKLNLIIVSNLSDSDKSFNISLLLRPSPDINIIFLTYNQFFEKIKNNFEEFIEISGIGSLAAAAAAAASEPTGINYDSKFGDKQTIFLFKEIAWVIF